jgi:ABC-type taurine transport system substrate-binding protein
MFVVEFVHADSEIGAPLTSPLPTTSCRVLRHAVFLLLDFLGNANDHKGKLSLASVEDVAVGEIGAIFVSATDFAPLLAEIGCCGASISGDFAAV